MILFELLKDVPTLTIRTCNKITWPLNIRWLKWLAMPIFMIVLCWYAIILSLPYRGAVERLAYAKYRETYLYEERVRLFDKQFALDMYTRCDRHFFISKLAWQDKLKALIIPYSC